MNTLIPNKLLFKWIGGKKWLSKSLLAETKTFNLSSKKIYIEPFIGGMGAFLAIFPQLKENNFEKIILNDINENIILTYNMVKTHPNDILVYIEKFEIEYSNTITNPNTHTYNKTKDKIIVKECLKEAEVYFKSMRKNFNTLKSKQNKTFDEQIQTVAHFLWLQEHSFNGVYRENNSGQYNTPFNWDNKKYNIENRKNTILEYSKFFNDNHIEFTNMDVFELLNTYKCYANSSFIYLDPPYLNKEEKNENQYNKDHFGLKEQNKLLDILRDYDCFLFSNHLMQLFEDYFKQENHSYFSIGRKNIMTAKKEDRSKEILEILGRKEV